MKCILITGANSYIGTSFTKWINDNYNTYTVDTVDSKNNVWKDYDFSKYDTIFHVSGIAHIKETKENSHMYYEVNRDLTVEIAKKAKEEGVRQFIYLSSMSVYGKNKGIIHRDTVCKPESIYGKSKLEAENLLLGLESSDFKVCIVRPPMVYGKGCKGNFQLFVKVIEKLKIFPYVKNKRSMIYIYNLTEFIRFLIDRNCSGIYFPQNREYVSTIKMAEYISQKLEKKVYFSHVLGFFVWIGSLFVPVLQKAFGSLMYENMDDFDFEYCKFNEKESILDSADKILSKGEE